MSPVYLANPIIVQLGSIEVRAFTAWVMLGVALCAALLVAALRGEVQPLHTLDVIIAGVAGGLIGARLGHVCLNWPYFADRIQQIVDVAGGGLDWHGAVVGGLIGVWLAAILRRVPLDELNNALALTLPIAGAAGWLASSAADAVYGLEVRTLTDFPTWAVVESTDIYGTLAPRLNLLPVGLTLCAVIAAVAAALWLTRALYGSRLWLLLAVFALGMGLIGFFRADYVPLWGERRADQWFDVWLGAGGVILFGTSSIYVARQRRTYKRRQHVRKIDPYGINRSVEG
jgi:prolipoprotein diacylglyceryltransferase